MTGGIDPNRGPQLTVIAVYLVVNAADLMALPLEEMAASELVAADAARRIFGPLGASLVAALLAEAFVLGNALVRQPGSTLLGFGIILSGFPVYHLWVRLRARGIEGPGA